MAVRRLGGRIVAFAATVALSIPLGLLTNSAWAVEDATRSDSTTQMSSTPEVVYSSAVDSKQNRTSDFDANWKFMLSDSVQAQDPAFDDSAWQQVDLPHDYSITQKYSQSNEAESAYLPGGTGWYRKSFTIDRDLAGKRIAINFDGVYMNATVWFNGVKLGTHPYGYSPFSFDLTGNAKFGGENTIVVKVENRLPSSRWYSGSGIYRDVTLTVTDGVHVGNNGVAIKTPSLATQNGGNVTMNLTTKVANDTKAAANITLKQTVFPKGGKTDAAIGTVTTASKSIAAGASADVTSTITAASPKLWSIKNPNLYTVRTEVLNGGKVLDTYDTEYGFRWTGFDAASGFSLNGEKVKLKGVSMHHDQGSLGAVANRRAIERQVEILQKMGKTKPEDELNCGACGYPTCREKAIAVYQGKADLSMCLPFLKEKAETFSGYVINNTPNAIFVLDENLCVQQINKAGCALFNLKTPSDILGSPIVRLLNPADYLGVMTSGVPIKEKKHYLAEYKKYVAETIVYDHEYHIVFSIMRDITSEEERQSERSELCNKTVAITNEVIEKQMRVVQEIASLLGETTAETKIALTQLKDALQK